MDYKVPFVNPAKNYQLIKDELDAAYFDVMSKGDLIDRSHLKSFEENLAKFVGTKYAVGLNSGYDSLHISLRAAGIGPGDEVIVPAHTFVATCSAVVNVGATPILVDIIILINLTDSITTRRWCFFYYPGICNGATSAIIHYGATYGPVIPFAEAVHMIADRTIVLHSDEWVHPLPLKKPSAMSWTPFIPVRSFPFTVSITTSLPSKVVPY